LADKAFGALKAPVKRVTVPNVAMPYAPNAEARVFPNEEQIINATLAITRAAAA
jgi:acetoin:2,6-dichlorophenolindophenol oxidoreductase subunit beta